MHETTMMRIKKGANIASDLLRHVVAERAGAKQALEANHADCPDIDLR